MTTNDDYITDPDSWFISEMETIKTDRAYEIFTDGNEFIQVDVVTLAFYLQYTYETVQDHGLLLPDNLVEYQHNAEYGLMMKTLGGYYHGVPIKNRGEEAVKLSRIEHFTNGRLDKTIIDYTPMSKEVRPTEGRLIKLDRCPWTVEENKDYRTRCTNVVFYRRLAFADIPENFKIEEEETVRNGAIRFESGGGAITINDDGYLRGPGTTSPDSLLHIVNGRVNVGHEPPSEALTVYGEQSSDVLDWGGSWKLIEGSATYTPPKKKEKKLTGRGIVKSFRC